MSTVRAAPDRFGLRPNNSAQEISAWKNQFVLGEDHATASRSKTPQQSDYEEEEVDESVREDMTKLEDTFPGISDRFRLVNRIGEGILSCSCLFPCQASLLTKHRYIFYCLQSRGSPL
jgi:cell division control protein 7